jgi:uncharacterized membrane protein HdeD (DUF308 family)
MTTTEPMPAPADRPLLRAMAEHWWVFLIRGLAAVVFSVLALMWPGLTILTLTLFWGAYALLDGVLALWAAITGKVTDDRGSRWWLLLVGVLGVGAGLIAFFSPAFTAGVLLITLAIWAIVIGVLEIIGAIRLRKEIDNEWWLILNGACAVIFGVLFFMQPAAGAMAVVWMISLFALIFGVTAIMLAFKLKGHKA